MPLLPSAPRPPGGPANEPAPASLRLPDELMSPEDIADRTRRRRRLLLVPLLLMVLTGLGFAARPTLHVIKAWQARRIAAQAEALIAQGKWLEARGKVMDAFQIWQAEPACLRAAARLLERTGNASEASEFWTRLEHVRTLTREEEREYTRSLVASRNFPLAEQHLRKVWSGREPGTPEDWELGMQIAAGRGRSSEAIELARNLVAHAAATARQRFKAAAILCSASRSETQGEGLKVLLALSGDKESPESLDALVVLAQLAMARLSSTSPAGAFAALPPLAELLERIEAHPRARVQHHLSVVDLRIAQDATRQATEIQGAVDRFGPSKDDEVLAALAGWLYGKGEPARVLAVVPPDRANDDITLFLRRLDALAVLGRWEEVRQAIQGRKVVMDPVLEQIYLARCADELKEPRVRDARWDAALDAAAGKLDKLMQVGTYAQKIGNFAVAIRAYEAAMAAAPDSREAASALAGTYQASGDTHRTRETLDLIAKRHPDDPAVRNDRAYYDALLERNVPAARDTARELMRTDPASLPHRVTFALAELRLGHHLTAMDAFKDIDLSHVSMTPSQRAVLAAVLWEASYNGQAREIARSLAKERLLPEERALIQPILDATAQNPSAKD